MSEGRQYEPKKSIKNWAAYNEGLKKRYDISVYFADESVFEKPAPTGEGGRPKEYSDGYIELGLTLKAIYRIVYLRLTFFSKRKRGKKEKERRGRSWTEREVRRASWSVSLISRS